MISAFLTFVQVLGQWESCFPIYLRLPRCTTRGKDWLRDAITGWNRQPTPFIWGGKRHARRDRAYARRHRQGGSGAMTQYVLPRRVRSVRFYRRLGNTDGLGK